MSFISDYLLATSNNESPANYHRWSCLSALSVLAGRRFHFRLGPFSYYPNFYCVLVGEPGVKKSAAMDVAKDLIRQVGGIPIAATSTSKEAITKEMGHEKFAGKRFFKTAADTSEEYNQFAIFATEFTTFLGKINPEAMLDFLTSIYTEKVYDEKYKNTGSAFFLGPYITMLACMTPETVKGYLKMNILTGGFSRRTMFVYGTRGKPNPWPGNTPEQQAALKRCVEWGKHIQQFSGEFVLSPDGADWYEKWYIDNATVLPDRKPNVQAYFGTKHEFLFKTAILLALAETEQRVITATQLEFLNNRFFAPAEELLERVFEGSGINPNAQATSQVVRMLEAMDKPMNKKMLRGMFYDQVTDLRALDDALSHLVAAGRLAERTITSNGQLLGTLIGVPGCFKTHTDSELVQFLGARGVLPPPGPGTDLPG